MSDLQRKLKDKELILGSSSPRRKQLLREMDLNFIVESSFSKGEESFPQSLKDEEVAEFLAKQKSLSFKKELLPNQILITADTIVIVDSQIIGKPKDLEQASKMLHSLSGKTHKVITGVALRDSTHIVTFSDLSKVKFSPLSTSVIEYYIQKYKPLDKAGAYGIQEWIGAIGIERIEGSYYNIMGLPTSKLYHELLDF